MKVDVDLNNKNAKLSEIKNFTEEEANEYKSLGGETPSDDELD